LDLEANHQGRQGKKKTMVQIKGSMWELQKPHIKSDVKQTSFENRRKTCKT